MQYEQDTPRHQKYILFNTQWAGRFSWLLSFFCGWTPEQRTAIDMLRMSIQPQKSAKDPERRTPISEQEPVLHDNKWYVYLYDSMITERCRTICIINSRISDNWDTFRKWRCRVIHWKNNNVIHWSIRAIISSSGRNTSIISLWSSDRSCDNSQGDTQQLCPDQLYRWEKPLLSYKIDEYISYS